MSMRPGAQSDPTGAPVWFAIVAGPVAWALQLLVGWWIEAWSCTPTSVQTWSPDTGRWLQFGVGLVCLAVTLAALAAGIAAWRRSANTGTLTRTTARPDFMAATAVLVSGVFALAIAWSGLAALMLPTCATVR